MRNRQSFYQRQRARDNRNGSIAMTMYKLEQREKAYNERFKPYNIHKTIAKALVGRRPRRRRKVIY
jgi:hypothetical protein